MASTSLGDIEIGGYTFSRRRLQLALKKYASERIRPHKSWLTDELRRPDQASVDGADLTEPVVLGQLVRPGGQAWVILEGLPQIMRAFKSDEAVTLVRLSLKDTVKLVTQQPPRPAAVQSNVPVRLRALLKRRQAGCDGCMGEFD